MNTLLAETIKKNALIYYDTQNKRLAQEKIKTAQTNQLNYKTKQISANKT